MRERARDYSILLAVSILLTLPNLGGPSLWDVDEGVNAQAAREMRDADTWIVPTFNYQLRTAKPVMLYWLQRASYETFGVNEFAARLPSVVAGWLAILLTYELARRMFSRSAGLLAGIVLASVVQFALLAHAATPDATLLLFTCLAFLAFWAGHENGSRRWWLPTAAACGLAVLTKGPIGVALPGLVILLYFTWNRELGRLLDRRAFGAALVFLAVAGPWYGLVANETRGEWVKAFIGRENLQRFSSPMDQHSGPFYYYLVALPVMFAPWSAFILAVLWYGARGTGHLSLAPSPAGGEGENSPPLAVGEGAWGERSARAHRFLIAWFLVYLMIFSSAATKLPNYIFPLYPALAILTARFLISWRDRELAVPRWVMTCGAAALALVGAVAAGGMILADRTFPGLGVWAAVGVLPIAGAAAMIWSLRRGDRAAAVFSPAAASVVFVAVLVTFPGAIVDRQKAPRELVRASGVDDPARDQRLAAYRWFQPSVVYYSGREVAVLDSPAAVEAFLATPTPGYLFIAEPVWREHFADRIPVPHRIAARRHDFLEKCEILVISNEVSETARR
jgi:4-amino-4-deoxy-L-arabinose transferase-like glycosyltransferase